MAQPLAERLAACCAELRALVAHERDDADAFAEAVTFGVVARAQGLDVPWLDEVPPVLRGSIEHACRSLAWSNQRGEDVYEAFLRLYSPAVRRAQGVFFTPLPLVRAQVRLVAHLLAQHFGCNTGFGDQRVLLIDPALGSGAYVLAAIDDAIERGACAGSMADRMIGFEPRIGAAIYARARLTAALGAPVTVRVEDALEATLAVAAPIVVCIGNPPYQRGAAREIQHLDRFRAAPGVHLKNIHNSYVYFWRWAMRTVLEQRAGPGVVSFVTAASFLSGPGFAGMRTTLRRAFDELWVIDLGGDRLGARQTDNVFPIRTPVAVAMGVRYGVHPTKHAAHVWYSRVEGDRARKLRALAALRSVHDLVWQPVLDSLCAPLVARRTTAYHSWPRLTELFPVQISGCQMKRTWPIGPSADVLRERWARLLALNGQERRRAFRPTRDRDVWSTPPGLLDHGVRQPPIDALDAAAAAPEPVPYAYRSFDRQWLLPDSRLGDFMRTRLWRTAGPRQVFLTSLLTNVLGPGPAAVATDLVPDLDHFRGSFGGRAVIPLWLDFDATRANVAPAVLAGLEQRYGCLVTAEDLLAYCYALLGSTRYVQRFHEELTEPGPRIPFPRDVRQFARGVELGRRLLWLHTRGPHRGEARCIVEPSTQPRSFTYLEGMLRVGDGAFGPVARDVWEFSISGLYVVRSWLTYRIGPPKRQASELDRIRPTWTSAITAELLHLLWLLEGTLSLQPALAAALDDMVA